MKKREIKFRAWDKEEKVMCPVTVINFEKGCFLVGNSPTPAYEGENFWYDELPEGHFVDFDKLELMQFTGAYDRNGKEIYEGDLIEFDAKEWGDNTTNIHTVEWDDYAHGWSFGGGGQQGDMEWRTVIGNIYEQTNG